MRGFRPKNLTSLSLKTKFSPIAFSWKFLHTKFWPQLSPESRLD